MPSGETEYIWPATSTRQGFTWFATSTVGKRGKGAADLRPYTLLSGWAAFVPGTRTTDFVTEERRPPLYGEDNLPSPWSNPQIRLVQNAFSPYLVADLPYWHQTGRSDEDGTFPVRTAVQPIGFGQPVTRAITVFNDGLSGDRIDFAWAAHADSPTGAVLASGQQRLTVPLAGKLTVPVDFTSPATGTAVYLTLAASVDGVVRFSDTGEYLPLGSAESIDDAAIGDGDRRIRYAGTWHHAAGQAGAYARTSSSSSQAGATATVAFTGNLAVLHADLGPDRGIVSVSVDRGPATPIDLLAATPAGDRPVWTSAVLPSGRHELTLRVTELKAPGAAGAMFTLDRIEAPAALTTTVVATASGPCLTVRDGNRDDGATIDLSECDRERVRSWTLAVDSRLANRETYKCLDIANGSTEDGAKIQQWTCNGGVNQRWVYDARQRLVNPASGKCLRVAGDGRQLGLGSCDAAQDSRWRLSAPIAASPPDAPQAVTGIAATAAVTVS